MGPMLSIDMSASSRQRFDVTRIAGDSWKLSRSENKKVACPSVAECGNTQLSESIPNERALATEHIIIAPPKKGAWP